MTKHDYKVICTLGNPASKKSPYTRVRRPNVSEMRLHKDLDELIERQHPTYEEFIRKAIGLGYDRYTAQCIANNRHLEHEKVEPVEKFKPAEVILPKYTDKMTEHCRAYIRHEFSMEMFYSTAYQLGYRRDEAQEFIRNYVEQFKTRDDLIKDVYNK